MNGWTAAYAFVGCMGFCFVFHLRGVSCVWASLGGALGWGVYLLLGFLQHDIPRYFIATLVLAAYCEVMARLSHKPATCYLVIAVLPLVPGGGIYYTMYYCLSGDNGRFAQEGLHTLGIAGALAAGILIVVSLTRLVHMVMNRGAFPCR